MPAATIPTASHALTLSPVGETLDEQAHALSCTARFSLSLGSRKLTFMAPAGPRETTVTSHLHRDMGDLLAAVPAGALLLVTGEGTPATIDRQLAAVAAGGFALRGVAWHYEHQIGGGSHKAVTERVARLVFARA